MRGLASTAAEAMLEEFTTADALLLGCGKVSEMSRYTVSSILGGVTELLNDSPMEMLRSASCACEISKRYMIRIE